MSHLSPEELQRWRDAPDPGARDRIVQHLAVCDECGALFAELIRTRPADEPSSRFEPTEFAARGYEAGAASGPGRRTRVFGRVLVPLAAAAALLLVVLPLFRDRTDPPPVETDIVRGEQIEGMAPRGELVRPDAAVEFVWQGAPGAARYGVDVRDALGARVFYEETRQPHLRAGDRLIAALVPEQSYSWTVSALDSEGEVVARSAPVAFTVRQPPD